MNIKNEKTIFFTSLLIFMISLSGCGSSDDGPIVLGNQTYTLTWDKPTQYEDGTTLPVEELTHYRIYYGTDSSSWDNMIEIDAQVYSTSYPIEENSIILESNTNYYLAMTAVNNQGIESQLSEILSFPAETSALPNGSF